MGEFWTANAAGVAVSLWNKFLLNGGWRACLIDQRHEESEHADDSSTSSTKSLDVHTLKCYC
jgi:hypothetical protein